MSDYILGRAGSKRRVIGHQATPRDRPPPIRCRCRRCEDVFGRLERAFRRRIYRGPVSLVRVYVGRLERAFRGRISSGPVSAVPLCGYGDAVTRNLLVDNC